MGSLQAKLARRMLAWQLRGWADGPLAAERARQERFSGLAPLPKGAQREPAVVDGVPAEWLAGAGPQAGTMLYLHGGAYTMGSINTHRELVARLAGAARLRALVIDYRLAPEHPYPAALEDALAAYRWLRGQGIPPQRLIVAGDSAGGGLALALLVVLREAGEPLPAGAALFSPWTDLALSGASVREKAAVDPILSPAGLRRFAADYAGERPLTTPLISPHYAAKAALPPLLIQTGTDEILLDDARRLAQEARAAGVAVTLREWEGLFHVFQTVGFLPETKEALAQFGEFVGELLQRP